MAEVDNMKKSFDKEDWIAKKAEDKRAVFELLETATESLSQPENLIKYLDVQSRFDRYSVSNALLVANQMPDATKLGDISYWNSQDVYINKGEKAISIIEPEEYTKTDGTKGTAYNAKKLFDISQTDCKPRIHREKHFDKKALIKILHENSKCRVIVANNLPENVVAQYDRNNNCISVQKGAEPDEVFRAINREIAFVQLDKKDIPENIKAFSATCVSYILSRKFNIEPPEIKVNSDVFADKENKEIRSLLKNVRDMANDTSAVIEKALSNRDRDAR